MPLPAFPALGESPWEARGVEGRPWGVKTGRRIRTRTCTPEAAPPTAVCTVAYEAGGGGGNGGGSGGGGGDGGGGGGGSGGGSMPTAVRSPPRSQHTAPLPPAYELLLDGRLTSSRSADGAGLA